MEDNFNIWPIEEKINELKSIHPDINVCVSSIVDIAIDNYHNHIVNEGGNQ